MTAGQHAPERLPELHVADGLLEQWSLVQAQAGFMGTSPDEIHGSHTLVTRFSYPGGMSTHLTGIEATSGRSNMAAVAARYARYADSAWSDRFQLSQFGVELAAHDERAPGTDLQTLGMDLMRPGGKVAEGGARLIRFRDLSQIITGRHIGVYPFMRASRNGPTAADPYTIAEPPWPMRLYMETELEALSLGEAQQLLKGATADQEARFTFWATRLRTPAHVAKLALLAAMKEKHDAR